MEKDLIIIGGGPGGYVAAIRAAQLGAKVLLVEKEKVGGTCLHWGCIPTKALYRNAEVYLTMLKAAEFGISFDASPSQTLHLDMNKVQARKQEVVDRLHAGIELLLKNHKVELFKGHGLLKGPNTVEVTDETGASQLFHAKHILLATGSVPGNLPIPGVHLPGVFTSNEVLSLTHVPKSMVIIGGGVIGVELACILQAFGTQVTIVELQPRILPMMDEEVIKRMTPMLKKKGIKLEVGTAVQEIQSGAEGLVVQAKGKGGQALSFEGEMVLIATGRSIQKDHLGLDQVGALYDNRGVKVNEEFATSVPGIYAVGDLTGGQMLAHVASHQGTLLVERLFGAPGNPVGQEELGLPRHPIVPSCVFSFPELASAGHTEEELKALGVPYQVSKVLFGANGKALTMGEGEGLIKLLSHKEDGTLLGVHILGPHASDLIHEGTLALHQRLTVQDLTHMIHAHPTLAESFHDAILGFK